MTTNNNVLVTLKDIKKEYRRKIALKNINLEINKGDRIGIIGANGSGKSTLVEIIAGIRKPSSGNLTKDPNMIIGIQFQESTYPAGISVQAMIQFYLKSFNISYTLEQLEALLSIYQLNSLRKSEIKNLSGGQRQRLNILLAMIHHPELVILDEISSGLDISAREDIFDYLDKNIIQKEVTLILVTHIMYEIEQLCEKVIFLHNGEIKEQKTVKEVIAEYGSIDIYSKLKFRHYHNETLIAKSKVNIIKEKNDGHK